MSMGFNCTIMELKSQLYSISDIQRVSFNCTIMELKYIKWISKHIENTVLIVPSWNWNSRWLESSGASWSFNCTIMELKYMIKESYTVKYRVLIVPSWNWNMNVYILTYWPSHVLIVPSWNWNPTRQVRSKKK